MRASHLNGAVPLAFGLRYSPDTMRILFLCTSGIENPSPRGRWLPLARELVRAGHAVDLALLHPTYDRLQPRRWMQEGVQIAHVGQMHVYGTPGHRRHFSPLRLMVTALGGALALARYAIWRRPDAIHIAKPQPINGLAGLLAARTIRCPLYVDCDDYEAAANRFSGRWQQLLVRWWEDRLPRVAKAVTVNTRFLYERCCSLGVAPERLFYVPNGVTMEQFQPEPTHIIADLRRQLTLDDHPVVLYLGTMSNLAHGVGLLIEAFAMVVRTLPAARLLMVGDGDDRLALQTQAHRLGLDGVIHWIGHVPAHQTRLYLGLADCSVDPVYDTPGARGRSPLKIVESLAQGVPVITGDVGDRAEILGEQAGIVVAPGDAQALAEGILRVLTTPHLRQALAAGAQQRAAAYLWSRLAQVWLTMYNLPGTSLAVSR